MRDFGQLFKTWSTVSMVVNCFNGGQLFKTWSTLLNGGQLF